MNQTSVIKIVGGGYRINLELMHRDYPEAQDYWDGNWVTARFDVEGLGRPISFTESLHLGDLECFQRGLERFPETGQGEAVLAMMEQYFTLVAALGPHAVQWTGRIRVRQGQRPVRAEPPRPNVLRHFAFETEPSSVVVVLEQVKATLKRFPIRSPRPHRERTDGSLDRERTYGSLAAVTAFLGRGGDPNHIVGGRALLSVVAQTGQAEAMRLLLGAGGDLHRADLTGATALRGAVGNGRLEAVRLLLERGARVNAPDGKGDTVLMLAAQRRWRGGARRGASAPRGRGGGKGTGPRWLDGPHLGSRVRARGGGEAPNRVWSRP